MANALFLALALLAQDGQVSPQSPNAPPSDEYGYVAWCYGALGGYASLYDQVMPEVTRIEKAFPGPDGVAASLKTYPELRAQAQKDLKVFASAITAAEKASPRPISEYGGTQVKRGAAIWQGAGSVDKARLAQMWMSWSPPGDCEKRARTLEMKSSILGRALNFNAVSATTQAPATSAPPSEEGPAPTDTPVPAPAATQPPAPSKAPSANPTALVAPPSAKEIIIDPANPIPCAGSLVPAKRGGKDVLICKAD